MVSRLTVGKQQGYNRIDEKHQRIKQNESAPSADKEL
jgi:hypothetical protein